MQVSSEIIRIKKIIQDEREKTNSAEEKTNKILDTLHIETTVNNNLDEKLDKILEHLTKRESETLDKILENLNIHDVNASYNEKLEIMLEYSNNENNQLSKIKNKIATITTNFGYDIKSLTVNEQLEKILDESIVVRDELAKIQ